MGLVHCGTWVEEARHTLIGPFLVFDSLLALELEEGPDLLPVLVLHSDLVHQTWPQQIASPGADVGEVVVV